MSNAPRCFIAFIFSITVLFSWSYAGAGALEDALTEIERHSLHLIDIHACKPIIEKELREALEKDFLTPDDVVKQSAEEVKRRHACLDAYSVFHSPEEYQGILNSARGNYEDIGADVMTKDAAVVIQSITNGGPAERAGLQAGDIVKAIRDFGAPEAEEVKDIKDAVNKLRGQAGTPVFITVIRNGINLVFPVVRVKVKIETVYSRVLPSGIGYIRVTRHNEETANDFESALRAFRSGTTPPRVIVDMRDNRGGILDSPLQMAFYFSKNLSDVAVTIRERTKETVHTVGDLSTLFVDSKTGKRAEKSPGEFSDYVVIVLVNRNTVSGAELFSGIMHDWGREHGRFSVVGTVSYGKGIGQDTFTLSAGVGLKFTTFEFLVGNSRMVINGVGVRPTIGIPDTRKTHKDTLTEQDEQFIIAESMLRHIRISGLYD